MKELRKSRLLKYVLIFLIAFACLIGGIISYFKNAEKKQIEGVYTVAQQLGHTPQSHLVQTERCWDIFPSHCGVFIHFSTDLTLDEFRARVDGLDFFEEWSGETNGHSIFSTINFGSDKLTVDGNGASNHLVIKDPLAYQWRLVDSQSKNWVITFYGTADDNHQYKFNSQPINDNIVTVMLRTK